MRDKSDDGSRKGTHRLIRDVWTDRSLPTRASTVLAKSLLAHLLHSTFLLQIFGSLQSEIQVFRPTPSKQADSDVTLVIWRSNLLIWTARFTPAELNRPWLRQTHLVNHSACFSSTLARLCNFCQRTRPPTNQECLPALDVRNWSGRGSRGEYPGHILSVRSSFNFLMQSLFIACSQT